MKLDVEGDAVRLTAANAGEVALLLQVYLRAKFFPVDDPSGLLSPHLNDVIETCLGALRRSDFPADDHYRTWVSRHHQARVIALLEGSSEFRQADQERREELLRTALYPGSP